MICLVLNGRGRWEWGGALLSVSHVDTTDCIVWMACDMHVFWIFFDIYHGFHMAPS